MGDAGEEVAELAGLLDVSRKLDRGAFTYYFLYPCDRLRSPAFRRFRVWLLEQAYAGEQPSSVDRTSAPTSGAAAG